MILPKSYYQNEALGPYLIFYHGHVISFDEFRCEIVEFLILGPFFDLISDFSESRDQVRISKLTSNILWTSGTIWYRSRDPSLMTPGTLDIRFDRFPY